MRVINYGVAIYWFVLLVLTATGLYSPSTLDSVVTMFVTSLFFVSSAEQHI